MDAVTVLESMAMIHGYIGVGVLASAFLYPMTPESLAGRGAFAMAWPVTVPFSLLCVLTFLVYMTVYQFLEVVGVTVEVVAGYAQGD